MKKGIILALALSFILISSAFLARFSQKTPQSNLVAIAQKEQINKDYYDAVFDNFLQSSTSTSTPEKISSTDLVGRQLVSEYISLASNGATGPENIEALAQKYIEKLPALNNAESVSYSDLKIVPNTKVNLQSYGDLITGIYRSYKTNMKSAGIDDEELSSLSPKFYSSAGNFSEIYQKTASALKAMPVPATLVQTHTDLINVYLSDAEAMKALADSDRDSTKAFAGLVALNENIDKEQSILGEITTILTSNGI